MIGEKDFKKLRKKQICQLQTEEKSEAKESEAKESETTEQKSQLVWNSDCETVTMKLTVVKFFVNGTQLLLSSGENSDC